MSHKKWVLSTLLWIIPEKSFMQERNYQLLIWEKNKRLWKQNYNVKFPPKSSISNLIFLFGLLRFGGLGFAIASCPNVGWTLPVIQVTYSEIGTGTLQTQFWKFDSLSIITFQKKKSQLFSLKIAEYSNPSLTRGSKLAKFSNSRF